MENKKCHTIGKVPKSKWKTRNATLSEQFKIPNEKQKMPHCRNSSKIQIKTNNAIMSEQFKTPSKDKKYHTVGTIPKSNRKIVEKAN